MSWALAGDGKECDQAAGEAYLKSSSGVVASQTQCLVSCQESRLCNSVSYHFHGGWCSHFSTKCEKTKNMANTVSFSNVESKSQTAVFKIETVFGSQCVNAGYLQNSPGQVDSLAACSKPCEASPRCSSFTFFSNKWCSHFETTCEDTKRSDGAITVRSPQNAIRTLSWSLHAGRECDAGAGEVYMSSSPGLVTLAQCLDKCEQSSSGCKSITYYEKSGWCSHFSTTCEKTKQGANTVSFSKVHGFRTLGWAMVDFHVECDTKKGENYLESSPGEDTQRHGIEGCIRACDLSADCQSVTYHQWFLMGSYIHQGKKKDSLGYCKHFSTTCKNTKQTWYAQSYRKVETKVTGTVVNTVRSS